MGHNKLGDTQKNRLPIDLHVHSNASSDGEFSISQICSLAASLGINTLAISDHNTVSGLVNFKKISESFGISGIPAIELDCIFEDMPLHILGYGIDPNNDLILKFCHEERRVMQYQLQKQIHLIREIGLFLNEGDLWEHVSDDQIPCIEHIAHVLLADQRNFNSPILQSYRTGGIRENMPEFNFYMDYGRKGSILYIPRTYQSAAKAIKAIDNSGGKAILAHPGGYPDFSIDLVKNLSQLGLNGVEIISSYHSADFTKKLAHDVANLGLAMTGGSDFHGRFKKSINMGIRKFFIGDYFLRKILDFIDLF